MQWREFKEFLLGRESYEELTDRHHVLLGGAPLSHDMRSILLLYFSHSLTHRFSCSLEIYGLPDVDVFRRAYVDLSHYILVYPPPSEVLLEGAKHETIKQLDRIAQRLRTPRPITHVFQGSDTLPTDGRWVFKREHSNSCSHVRDYDLGRGSKGLNEFLRSTVTPSPFRWLIQSHVPLLEKWGEWRVFLIGGKVIETVLTTRDKNCRDWTWNRVQDVWPLNL